MAKFQHERLDNRGAKLHYLADDVATSYTELALGSDFTGPRYTMSTGEGMAYEDAGHRNPIPQDRGGTGTFTIKLNRGVAKPVFQVGDLIKFVKEYSDGTGTYIFIVLTEVDPGSLSPNGFPQWTGTYVTKTDPIEIAAADLADILSLDEEP